MDSFALNSPAHSIFRTSRIWQMHKTGSLAIIPGVVTPILRIRATRIMQSRKRGNLFRNIRTALSPKLKLLCMLHSYFTFKILNV